MLLRIMYRKIFLFVVLAIIGIRLIESRVYCQDSNAKPWMPLGITCPVICASIRNAIDSLMMSDYKNTINHQLGSRQKINNKALLDTDYHDGVFSNHKYHMGLRKVNNSISNKADKIEFEYEKESFKKRFELNTENNKINIEDNKINTEDNNSKTNDETTQQLDENIYMNQYTAIFRNLQNMKGILRRSNNKRNSKFKILNKIAGKCWYMEKFTEKLLLGRIGYRPCTRKSNFDVKFIQIMTNILNKYADSLFKFTDEMTEILLENIFGSNADLRNNIFDVNKLLKYLRKSVDLHNNHSHGHVVTLESKHCLTLNMPGCFCKPGYVESAGQCVHPSDCVSKEYNQYLARIIVL